MNDPVLWIAVGGLAVVLAVSYVVPYFRRSLPAITASASKQPAMVPSRYRWTEQEVTSLKWAAANLPASITVTEFLSKMYVDDMVSETCVLLLSPEKEVAP